ncbi:uncharacterized protein [Nicotiana tomentosiformis]|uniref:uncharacterized protein n=1 Tax=Nicotiana tomentosiformis TaxID=4098 RepID=UPI00388CD3E6
MKDLRDELDVLVPLSSCDCEESRPSVEHLRSQRLLQFLMRLYESYSNIRSYVLAKRLVVTVNEVYAIVTQEESQRSLGVVDTHREPLAMLAGRGQDFKGKRPGIICEHCGYKGHLKKNCFKIIGYPADFKSKRKNQIGGGKVYTNNVNANNEEGKAVTVQVQGTGQFFIEEQYKQLVKLLSKPSTSECSTNMTSIISLLENACMCDWVIDIGATHHVTYCKDILSSVRRTDDQGRNKVQLPTRNKDLYSVRVIGIGRENNGLYLLMENIIVVATSSL